MQTAFGQPLARQITEVLLCDPRPAYRKQDEEENTVSACMV